MKIVNAATRPKPSHLSLRTRCLRLPSRHGALRRLNEKLRGILGLAGRFECVTIDSFAWWLLRRWRGLTAALGIQPPREDQHDAHLTRVFASPSWSISMTNAEVARGQSLDQHPDTGQAR